MERAELLEPHPANPNLAVFKEEVIA